MKDLAEAQGKYYTEMIQWMNKQTKVGWKGIALKQLVVAKLPKPVKEKGQVWKIVKKLIIIRIAVMLVYLFIGLLIFISAKLFSSKRNDY